MKFPDRFSREVSPTLPIYSRCLFNPKEKCDSDCGNHGTARVRGAMAATKLYMQLRSIPTEEQVVNELSQKDPILAPGYVTAEMNDKCQTPREKRKIVFR